MEPKNQHSGLISGDRLLALDALRLAASLIVFVQHFFIIFAIPRNHILTSGILDAKGAVTLFFVLSGYVLSISLSRAQPSLGSYFSFGIRRAFRIYPVYWFALGLSSFVLFWIYSNGNLVVPGEMGASFLLGKGIQLKQWLLQTTLLAPGMKSDFAIPPVWTLMTEAKIAIVFPFLIWFLFRTNLTVACLILAVLVFGSGWLEEHVVGTAAILGQFGIGAMIHRLPAKIWNKFNLYGWLAFIALSVLLYSCVSYRYVISNHWISYYLCAFGSAGFIIIASHCPFVRMRLDSVQRKLKYDISYGMYILHYPIMIGLCKLNADDRLTSPLWVLFIITLLGVTSIALLLHHMIEMPAVVFARSLTKSFTPSRNITPNNLDSKKTSL
ncbi:MAG: acyltransferase [Prosthecobacter sp.]|nr:acyltransferase [Prosthecobacter sp.]